MSSACGFSPGRTAGFEFLSLLKLRRGEGEFLWPEMNESALVDFRGGENPARHPGAAGKE